MPKQLSSSLRWNICKHLNEQLVNYLYHFYQGLELEYDKSRSLSNVAQEKLNEDNVPSMTENSVSRFAQKNTLVKKQWTIQAESEEVWYAPKKQSTWNPNQPTLQSSRIGK